MTQEINDTIVVKRIIRATDSNGVQIQDASSIVGVDVQDTAIVALANSARTFNPTASGVTMNTGISSFEADISPGSITTGQTWTITITNSSAGNSRNINFDIWLAVGSSAVTGLRGVYRASINAYRFAVGATATLTINEHINDFLIATITLTAIADGLTIAVTHGNVNSLNRTSAIIKGTSTSAVTITSAVA